MLIFILCILILFSSLFHFSSYHLQNTVDKLFQKANTSIMVGTFSWWEQFVEAITVSAGKLIIVFIIDCANTS